MALLTSSNKYLRKNNVISNKGDREEKRQSSPQFLCEVHITLIPKPSKGLQFQKDWVGILFYFSQ